MDSTIEAQYIPHSKIEEFKEAGWEIRPLNNHHGFYSVLAVREVEDGKTD